MFRNLFNPSWEVSPETVTYLSLCLFVSSSCLFFLFVHFFAVGFASCLFASPLVCFLCLFICTYHCFFVQPWLVPDCVILLLSEIESCDTNSLYTVNTVLLPHSGSSWGSHSSERDHQATWRDGWHLHIHSSRQGSVSLVLRPRGHFLL